jgi:LPS-assembly protein
MKNNLINNIIVLITFLSLFTNTLADEFNFNVTEVQIYEKGNLIKGIKGGTVTTENNIIITADNFEYNKLTTLFKAIGNVKLIDQNQNITIESNEVYYLKNKEEIYTVGKSKANNGLYIEIDADEYFKYNKLTSILEAKGNVIINDKEEDITIESNEVYYKKNQNKFFTIGKTKAFVHKKYIINTSDLIFLENKMLLSSEKKTVINDNLSNFYTLNEFEYKINEEILKGKGIEISTITDKPKSDKYFFETGFFDFKNNKFLGKDIEIVFHKEMYDDIENDPRLKGVVGSGNEFYTNIDNAVFTTCKKTDKCPPWVIKSNKVTHDKIKKQIVYKDAFLKIYDVPVVYFPKFFHPDPTVKRQSGLLAPSYSDSSTLGSHISTPYFHVISDSKDITFMPRIYDSDKYIFQTEYKQKTAKSYTIADFSVTKGHNSSHLDRGDNRSHLFTKTEMNLDFDSFLRSKLEIQYQKVSNDNYLKLFTFDSVLLKDAPSTLESSIDLDLEHVNYNFSLSAEMYETLGGLNSDRYQYVLPSYNFSKTFGSEDLDGSLNFNSYGNYNLSQTNKSSTSLSNDLNYLSQNDYLDNGIKNSFEVLIRNLNTVGKNNTKYKTSPQSELITSYMYNMSIPLIKETPKYQNYLEPKFSIKFTPHDMKNHINSGRTININSIYNIDRLGMGDSFESGESITYGIQYKKDKIIDTQNIKEIERYLDFRLAAVIRNKEEKNISQASTLGKKNSNIFGGIKYNLSKHLSFDYYFSAKKDLSKFEYNSLDTTINFNNFSTNFLFEERQGVIGSTNVLENTTKYKFNESNSLQFKTRRNKEINLTEYYDLIYEYKNDCLTAGIKYKKKYYKDNDIIPTEELFFSITIIPFATFSPDQMVLNKDRID